ncbi:MAG: tRNA threonylcarbamoyladenosine dehydratase [Campylobacterales bacterium]|nr:tRNA threonylcarbamoyladenosine dehydratase [Campylobacterales bacterium]MBN2832288.1 tRNA threonylcarbamoyladenosine dehydratase [Campylobacterales bacterium]
MDDRFTRVRSVLEHDFEKLQNAHILLLGVGGVGSVCLDALLRTGIGHVTIVDDDVYDITNQNRQLGSEAVGEVKVTHLASLYPNVTPLHVLITPTWVEAFDFSPYDVVIDAIDDMPAKIAVAHKTSEKLLSSSGSAKKLDPTRIRTASIWKTHGDALAKKMRYELKKSGFSGDFVTVFSDEEPTCKELGSLMCVTGAFGFALASLAIRKITGRM